MKKFQFSLERVKEWRRVQEETEQARLELLTADLLRLQAAVQELELSGEEAARHARISADPFQLVRLDHYRDYIRRARLAASQRQGELENRIAQQRGRLVEARRHHKALTKLRGKALQDWQAGFNRELEEQASESATARWHARQRTTGPDSRADARSFPRRAPAAWSARSAPAAGSPTPTLPLARPGRD